jgi:two-component system, chemotaxis family, CheB/CheR fusion protein
MPPLGAEQGERGIFSFLRRAFVGSSPSQGEGDTQHAAALLAAIVASSDDAIISKTLNGIITSWNASAERLFGYTAAEAIGQPVTLIIPTERHEEENDILRRIRLGQRVEHFETIRVAKDGRRVNVSLTISPVHDRQGRVIGASKVGRDITARKRAAEESARSSALLSESRDELQRVNAELSEADRRKDEFLAVLAHELRNPLAPIRNAMQYLRLKAPPDAAQQNARDIIDRQVKHLIRLVDDLLDISRISSGKISLQKERVSLALIVTNAIEASRPLIESENHRLTVTLPAEPVYLDADLTRIAQVLQNLLNNAARYTPPGGKIALHAEFDGQQVVIRVTDTGIGIPRDMLSHVFDMFTQVDRSIERSTGGLGIGLTLVQRLVELHGGNVEARSDGPDQGSEFIVRLPAFVNAGESSSAVEPGEAAPTARLRILVVDDNIDAADSLAEVLRASGHDVHTEYEGAAAIRAVQSHRPDVVLLDIGLPKLNGYETAREIRAIDPQRPVVLVAVTGWGQDEDRRRSRQAGFDHHLVKPLDPELLDRILASVVPTMPDVAARR